MAGEKNNNTQQTFEDFARQIAQLGEDVKQLKAYKASKEAQQLQYPLDYVSQQIIQAFVSASGPRSMQLGGTKGFGIYFGSGTPNAVIKAAQGSLYLNYTGNSTSSRAYINTDGATAWTAVTTAT